MEEKKQKILISIGVCLIIASVVLFGLTEFFMPKNTDNEISTVALQSDIDGNGNEKELQSITTNLTENQANVQTKAISTAADGAIVCNSIVEGIRDSNLANGDYVLRVTGNDGTTTETIDYPIELINYYDDVTYSLGTTTNEAGEEVPETRKTISLGDENTENYRMLVVKYHKNLTIDEGVTVTATAVDDLTYKKGMYLCVMGNLKNNGTISMTARGTYNMAGENVYLWKNLDNTYEFVPELGAIGGKGKNGSCNNGVAGVLRQTGGGGSGGTAGNGAASRLGGNGGTGTSYSGGAGGGGSYQTSKAGSYRGDAGSSVGGARR